MAIKNDDEFLRGQLSSRWLTHRPMKNVRDLGRVAGTHVRKRKPAKSYLMKMNLSDIPRSVGQTFQIKIEHAEEASCLCRVPKVKWKNSSNSFEFILSDKRCRPMRNIFKVRHHHSVLRFFVKRVRRWKNNRVEKQYALRGSLRTIDTDTWGENLQHGMFRVVGYTMAMHSW